MWAVDVNARALDLLRRSARDLGLANVSTVTPDEVPRDVRFAAVWSNPTPTATTMVAMRRRRRVG